MRSSQLGYPKWLLYTGKTMKNNHVKKPPYIWCYIYIWFYYEYPLAYHIHFVMNIWISIGYPLWPLDSMDVPMNLILNIHWFSCMRKQFNNPQIFHNLVYWPNIIMIRLCNQVCWVLNEIYPHQCCSVAPRDRAADAGALNLLQAFWEPTTPKSTLFFQECSLMDLSKNRIH